MQINRLPRAVMEGIVPISRFNRGEAAKVFDEVRADGAKVVLKNNAPACVLLSPEEYNRMIEAIEDYELAMEAQARIAGHRQEDAVPFARVMREAGIDESALKDVEVAIE